MKDMIHRRRSKGKKGMKLSFNVEMSLSITKDVFLNDATNKQRFIALLGEQLSKNNCTVYYAKSDADFIIVQKAVETAENSNTVIVGDDTDLLVLLIYHTKLNHNEIFFIPEPKKNSKCRIWNVKQVKTELGSFVCKHILFLHAMLGCDTTSRLFRIGKGTILKKFKANVELQKAAEVFDSTLSTSSQIESAGERVLVVMYGGKNNESIIGNTVKNWPPA